MARVSFFRSAFSIRRKIPEALAEEIRREAGVIIRRSFNRVDFPDPGSEEVMTRCVCSTLVPEKGATWVPRLAALSRREHFVASPRLPAHIAVRKGQR